MAYATEADLVAFTGKPAPTGAARLLERASTTVAGAIRAYVGLTPEGQPARHAAVIRDAVCAQVEYWAAVSERVDVAGEAEDTPRLAPRAEALLSGAGLRNPAVSG